MRRIAGFTLVELMVTVAVLAILMAIAGPAFNDFFERYRLRGAADEVASVVASARAEALMRNRDVSVVFTGVGGAWCVGATAAPEPAAPGDAVTTSPSCTCADTCKLGDRVVEAKAASHPNVALEAAPAAITFGRANGARTDPAPSAAANATLKSPSGKYSLRVAVSPLGRGRLCTPSGSPSMSGFEAC